MSAEIHLLKNIDDQKEQQNILHKHLEVQGNLYLKDKFDRTLPLKIVSLDSQNMVLKCISPTATPTDLFHSESFMASFTIGNEKYLFETRPQFIDRFTMLTVMRFYHLQKRHTIRYQIPSNYSAQFIINSHNQVACAYHCQITDISSLGCAVLIPKDLVNLKSDDLIQADITLDGSEQFPIHGVVKNIRQHNSKYFVVGFEFHHMFYASEQHIVSLIHNLKQTNPMPKHKKIS